LDVSSKDAPVPPDLPVSNCDCGRSAWYVNPNIQTRLLAASTFVALLTYIAYDLCVIIVYYMCTNASFHLCRSTQCVFFQWIDGPDKFDPQYLLFANWLCGRSSHERFKRWVPPESATNDG
jgi:hypothetical protein